MIVHILFCIRLEGEFPGGLVKVYPGMVSRIVNHDGVIHTRGYVLGMEFHHVKGIIINKHIAGRIIGSGNHAVGYGEGRGVMLSHLHIFYDTFQHRCEVLVLHFHIEKKGFALEYRIRTECNHRGRSHNTVIIRGGRSREGSGCPVKCHPCGVVVRCKRPVIQYFAVRLHKCACRYGEMPFLALYCDDVPCRQRCVNISGIVRVLHIHIKGQRPVQAGGVGGHDLHLPCRSDLIAVQISGDGILAVVCHRAVRGPCESSGRGVKCHSERHVLRGIRHHLAFGISERTVRNRVIPGCMLCCLLGSDTGRDSYRHFRIVRHSHIENHGLAHEIGVRSQHDYRGHARCIVRLIRAPLCVKGRRS